MTPQQERAYELRQQGHTLSQIQHIMGLNSRGQVWRMVDTAKQRVNEMPILEFPEQRIRYEKPADYDSWQDTLLSLNRRGHIVVAHDCDNHFNDTDESALNMRYRLYARKQPDIIVVGSDAADFSVLSNFDQDPDTEEGIDDALLNFDAYWKPHIDNLNRLCPKAVKVFIFGNHERRIHRYLHKNAPKLRRTVERVWLETVRYGGVLYIGDTEEVELSHLLVMHGNRANEHVAKSLLEDNAYQVHVMAGHVHRATDYTRQGRKYLVSAITSGCAQNLQPAYAAGRSLTRKWQHGVAFATVDMKGTDVFFDNVRFSHAGNKVIAPFGSEVLEIAA